MQFCAVGIYVPGTDRMTLMASSGKIILFDTPALAGDFLPLLGEGRVTRWLPGGETAYWLPTLKGKISRAAVVTNYDPYHLPGGMAIPSEAKGKEWKRHIMWSYVFTDCGQYGTDATGQRVNLALEK